tara:strand:+ start:644 stop:832 length:189 start_codon:yes stop_codon:yes gene_type:complete
MAKHTKENMAYDKWFRMLNKIAKKEHSMNLLGMEQEWKEFYDDGYTPREALDEDTYAGISKR